jgi:hypothetical protein
MASSGPNPVPPTSILSTKSIPQSAAHDFLAAYLDRAANDPSLQPNAMISEHGPVSRTTAAAPNLTLHNLKRVQAGLAGEVLGRDLTLPNGTQVEPQPQQNDEDNAAGGQEGWEDREKWQLEAGGEGVGKDREQDFVDNTGDDIEVDEEGMPIEPGKIDKEERKRKKKERRQAEKKARKQHTREVGGEDDEMSE